MHVSVLGQLLNLLRLFYWHVLIVTHCCAIVTTRFNIVKLYVLSENRSKVISKKRSAEVDINNRSPYRICRTWISTSEPRRTEGSVMGRWWREKHGTFVPGVSFKFRDILISKQCMQTAAYGANCILNKVILLVLSILQSMPLSFTIIIKTSIFNP